MSTQTLFTITMAAMTTVALMIAINSRGRWRATISSLLAICLLGATTWVFILQYSITPDSDAQSERRKAPQNKERTSQKITAAALSLLVTEINDFADALYKEKMYDPIYSREQLVARADGAEQRLEALQNDVAAIKENMDTIPETMRLMENALTELKSACQFYRAYYFAENTDAEVSIERLIKQKARSAKDTLAKAKKIPASK